MHIYRLALFGFRSVRTVFDTATDSTTLERARRRDSYGVIAANLTPRVAEVRVDSDGGETEVRRLAIGKMLCKLCVQHAADVLALDRSWGHAAALVVPRMYYAERVGRHMPRGPN